ncbi:HTH DNA binding domain-containing protein [Natronoarchaeum philippinense]|uniref:HTH DNA binding domain-containing protein n=1 Tax=Natronoarchaeum philippinense TaxID=558529 RepID=A0A285NUL5_NATPI|nr:helix-turn-helix domain-containing protein [Natronoarchaeum philippinense]SNZ12613.1 HTH DNA binding domain-containing protein [Natronoarchaeum philippinense]
MRYLTALVEPAAGAFHPLGRELSAEPSIQREAIHHVELLDDGTVLLFAEGSGDRGRYEAIMRDSPHVVEYMVSGEERWTAVSQFEPTALARRTLELQRDAELVVETPIRFDADGAVRVTYLGDDAAFRELYETVNEAADIDFEVLETGEYDPDEASLARLLTTRQQEVLETAVEVGYYRTPREATLEDIAERVDVAPTTAGEHLRKIEERVFGALVS